MNVPTDRLLIMLVVATAFAVVGSGWAAGLVHAEATGTEEYLLRIAITVAFVAVLIVFWFAFRRADRKMGRIEWVYRPAGGCTLRGDRFDDTRRRPALW
ncbi:hypothetical protein [Halovivax gelatinilyticus]|uniref:hypothetical protein n=1 Tax=Halovivax gelatinilyticus TaxID=2961597 RepID=UPI003CCDDD0E